MSQDLDGRWLALFAVGVGVATSAVVTGMAGRAGSQVKIGPRLRPVGPEPMITVTNRKGRPFHVVVVRPGDRYGLNNTLVYPDKKSSFEQLRAAAGDVMVEFYDGSQDLGKFGPRGQFVSRYYLSTLEDHDSAREVSLMGGIPDWTVTAANMKEAVAFARATVAFARAGGKTGSTVRVGPRLRLGPSPADDSQEWVAFGPFGKQVRTGVQVRITQGSDKGRIGRVNAERDTTMETALTFNSGPGLGETSPDPGSKKGPRRRVRWYGVAFDDGLPGMDGYLYPRDHLSWHNPGPYVPKEGFPYSSGSPVRVGPRLRVDTKLARVRLVHKISPSDKDAALIAVAPGDLDDIVSVLRWLKGNGYTGLGPHSKWRKEPDGKIVFFFGRDSSWHSLIIEPILPGSPNSGSPNSISASGLSSKLEARSSKLLKKLEPLRAAMEDAFSCTTAFGTCRTDRPSSGHCMLAAMVVQDMLGGCILQAEVGAIPHYWNQVDGLEVDLTGDQFGRPAVCVGASLYPGSSVFPRDPKKSLVPSLNAELLGRHRQFVDVLVPAMHRQGLVGDAAKVQRIVDGWPVMTRGSPVRVGPRFRPTVVEPKPTGTIGPGIRFGDDLPQPYEDRPYLVLDGVLSINEQGDLYESPIGYQGSVEPSLFAARHRRGEEDIIWKLLSPAPNGRTNVTEAVLSGGHGFGIRIRLRSAGNRAPFTGAWGNHVFHWVAITPNLIRVPHMRTGKEYILLDRRGSLWTGDADAAQIIEFEAVPF